MDRKQTAIPKRGYLFTTVALQASASAFATKLHSCSSSVCLLAKFRYRYVLRFQISFLERSFILVVSVLDADRVQVASTSATISERIGKRNGSHVTKSEDFHSFKSIFNFIDFWTPNRVGFHVLSSKVIVSARYGIGDGCRERNRDCLCLNPHCFLGIFFR